MEKNKQFNIQNAYNKDFPAIHTLMSLRTTKFFGPSKRKSFHADNFFESYSTHRMVVREEATDKEIIAYAEFKNYPAIKALPSDCWMEWLRFHFCVKLPLSLPNTLFFYHFVYNTKFNPDLFLALLCEVFFREYRVRYIVGVEPPFQAKAMAYDEPDYSIFEDYGTLYYPKEYSVKECSNTIKLHVIFRDNIIPKMRYRHALAEDNDDIVEIINIDRPELKDELGEYYIAEEIMSNSPNKTLIVTEVSNETVGFIWLNDSIDIWKLVKNFELKSFGNFIKFSFNAPWREVVTHVNILDRRTGPTLFTNEAIDEMLGAALRRSSVFRREMSSYSLASTYNLNLSEIEMPVPQRSKKFNAREKIFREFEALNEHLRCSDYYVHPRLKLLKFYYNVDEVTQHEMPTNVFALQLFGLHNSNDFRKMFRFLCAAFTSHPNKDYCIFSMPASWKVTPTLNELLRYFSRILPRPGCTIDDIIYVTHRSCVFGDISVLNVRLEDAEEIEYLLYFGITNLQHRSTTTASILPELRYDMGAEAENEAELAREIMYEVFTNPFSDYKFMTIRIGDSTRPVDENVIIGFVILRQFSQIHLLRKHFILINDQKLKFFRAEIVLLKLHPLFNFDADFIFREIARNAGYWDFYYFYPKMIGLTPLTNDLMTRMQPIEPKRCKKKNSRANEVGFVSRKSIASMLQLNFSEDNFAVYQHNLRPTKFFGRQDAIVIVGFNDICKALLRLLIFDWNSEGKENANLYCCIPRLNVVVIAAAGIVDAAMDFEFCCDYCTRKNICWISWQNTDAFLMDSMIRMDLSKWVKFVNGTVKDIDRDRKVVVLDNMCEINYNYLIITCDSEFGAPKRLETYEDLPPNYQDFNYRLDKLIMYHKLRAIQLDETLNFKILVYGNRMRTFEFINFLLEHGVDAKYITLVIPTRHSIEAETLLNDPYDDRNTAVVAQEMVEDLGVNVLENLEFSHWMCYDFDANIEKVVFNVTNSPDNEVKFINCDLFVSFADGQINDEFEMMLNQAGIITKNHEIAIDWRFRTNDPHILAAGRHTVIAFDTNTQYRFVSPREIAEKILKYLNNDDAEYNGDSLKFLQPHMRVFQLPFDYYMAKVSLPKLYLANHLSSEYSYSLVTYCDYDFCRVRLNEHSVVEEILVSTQKNMCFDFLKFFCGKHETMLSNLRSRWYLRAFDNFLEFFQEPWTDLIMHDNFEELKQQNREVLLESVDIIMSVKEDRRSRREMIFRYLKDTQTEIEIYDIFLDFLRKYRKDFSIDLPDV